MITFLPREVDELRTLISRQTLSKLTARQWELVILNLIRDEELCTAASEGRKARPFISAIPDIAVDVRLRTFDREGSGALRLFQDELPTKAREKLFEGLNTCARRFYKAAQTGNTDAMLLLEEVLLGMAGVLDGAIHPALAQDIVLDKKMPTYLRGLVAHTLVERDFRSSPPRSFWEAVTKEVPQTSELAGALISFYVAEHNYMSALDVLGLIGNTSFDHSVLVYSLVELFEKMHHDALLNGGDLSRRMKDLPDWIRELIKDEVWPNLSPSASLSPIFFD